MTLQLILGRYW